MSPNDAVEEVRLCFHHAVNAEESQGSNLGSQSGCAAVRFTAVGASLGFPGGGMKVVHVGFSRAVHHPGLFAQVAYFCDLLEHAACNSCIRSLFFNYVTDVAASRSAGFSATGGTGE